jgi:hypothetical protein
MFIKLTGVNVNSCTDDPKKAVAAYGYITINSDQIVRYRQRGFTKDGVAVAEYTTIVLRDDDCIDVAERKADIDMLLSAYGVNDKNFY